jgi:hypothetical protein
MKKNKFMKTPYLIPLVLPLILFLFFAMAFCLKEYIRNQMVFALVFLLIIFFIFFIPCFLGFLYCLKKIEINEDIVLEKNFFGKIKNKCKISEIVEVRIETYARTGTYIILKDNRQTSKDFLEKKAYIKFMETKKSLNIIKKFWKDPINRYKI